MSYQELDNHMLIERELMLSEADDHAELQEILAQEAQDEEDRKAGRLTDAEAEALISEYIRSDRSAKHIEDDLPY